MAVVLAVVAASGLMSVLPGQSQVAVSRFTCHVASLGLGACGRTGVNLENTGLNLPRCPALAALDQTVPEVRVTELTAKDDLRVTIDAARNGDVSVQFGPPDESALPFVLNGQTRSRHDVAAGVSLPTSAEWFLPSGQGLDQLVQAVQNRHQQWVQRRSALAVLSRALARGDADIPAPTVLYGQVRLDEGLVPTYPDQPVVPRSGTEPRSGPLPLAPENAVSVVSNVPATTVFNRVSRDFSVVAPVSGVLRRTPVTGSVRWTRDADGNVTSVVIAVLTRGELAAGERVPPGVPTTGVAYISVPVTTEPERALAQQWLSDPDGFRLGLGELLGLALAEPGDRLASFLTRAATVTLVRYSGVDLAEAQLRVRGELTALRRVDWSDARLVSAATIAPQPSGSARTLVDDRLCRTP